MDEVEKAKEKFVQVIPHLRLAMKRAAEKGKPQLGVLAVAPDGSGTVVVKFDAAEFVEDLAKVVGAPPPTEESEMDAKAAELLHQIGLK